MRSFNVPRPNSRYGFSYQGTCKVCFRSSRLTLGKIPSYVSLVLPGDDVLRFINLHKSCSNCFQTKVLPSLSTARPPLSSLPFHSANFSVSAIPTQISPYRNPVHWKTRYISLKTKHSRLTTTFNAQSVQLEDSTLRIIEMSNAGEMDNEFISAQADEIARLTADNTELRAFCAQQEALSRHFHAQHASLTYDYDNLSDQSDRRYTELQSRYDALELTMARRISGLQFDYDKLTTTTNERISRLKDNYSTLYHTYDALHSTNTTIVNLYNRQTRELAYFRQYHGLPKVCEYAPLPFPGGPPPYHLPQPNYGSTHLPIPAGSEIPSGFFTPAIGLIPRRPQPASRSWGRRKSRARLEPHTRTSYGQLISTLVTTSIEISSIHHKTKIIYSTSVNLFILFFLVILLFLDSIEHNSNSIFLQFSTLLSNY